MTTIQDLTREILAIEVNDDTIARAKEILVGRGVPFEYSDNSKCDLIVKLAIIDTIIELPESTSRILDDLLVKRGFVKRSKPKKKKAKNKKSTIPKKTTTLKDSTPKLF